mgnify:FL=1
MTILELQKEIIDNLGNLNNDAVIIYNNTVIRLQDVCHPTYVSSIGEQNSVFPNFLLTTKLE